MNMMPTPAGYDPYANRPRQSCCRIWCRKLSSLTSRKLSSLRCGQVEYGPYANRPRQSCCRSCGELLFSIATSIKLSWLRSLVERTAPALESCIIPIQTSCSYVFDPIQTSCSYVFYYKRYVKQLEGGLKRLCDVRAALQREVDAAKTQRKTVSPEVESWLAEVDAVEEAAQRFIGDAESRKHLYEPIARYLLSRKSVEMLRMLLERQVEGNQFRKVADAAPPPRIGSTFVRILNPGFSRPN
ncbi:cc-nbs-lrr resistance protein [Corchorus olitorius]|uniref:Cc-nbs-lrr resistance protein n=1 Tax=Corchorus olitorius TaxID=93759 RepID=A0A1R3K2I5_9ROSI|nr:cc-nbs-lrr resistance protein [Corchorus olitorius]